MAPNSACALNTSPKWFRMAPEKWSNWRGILCNDPFVLSYGDILIDPANYPRMVAPPDDTEAIITVKYDEDEQRRRGLRERKI